MSDFREDPSLRKTYIGPSAGWLNVNVGELWGYRDLVFLFVRRDFLAQYKQTILGPAWHFVQPLMTTLIFSIVFGKIARIPTDSVPPFLFYLSGVVVWSYFSTVFVGTAGTFSTNSHLFGKVYFPRLVTPISLVLSKLIAFSIQFFLYLLVLAFFLSKGADLRPNLWVLALPAVIVQIAALGMGCGIIISSLTVRYRDLGILVGFGVQLWMYLSPVVYPASSVPGEYRMLAMLNPMTSTIEFFRYAFLGVGMVRIGYIAISTGLTICVFVAGTIIFSKVERTFIDTI